LLNLADNFYEDGVTNDTDPQWQLTYRNVFKQASLQIPWVSMLGNHDHDGVAQAQIDYYLNKRDTRWILPDYYYSVEIPIGDGITKLQLVVIDTILLDPDLTQRILESDANPVRRQRLLQRWHHPVHAQHRRRAAADQWQWIRDTLSVSSANWLLVAGHYPMYSGGAHGDNAVLIQKLKPMLEQYKVDTYLSGHDHTLQYLVDGPVTYFVNGNAAKHDGTYHSRPQSKWASLRNGYTHHCINATTFTTNFVDEHGVQLHTVVQQRRR